MYRTNQKIEYREAPYPGTIATIPKGTPVIPATNLPEPDQYWAEPWDDMSDGAESWMRNYGFMIDSEEVEEY